MFALFCVLVLRRTCGCCHGSLQASEQKSLTEAEVGVAGWNKKSTRSLPGYFLIDKSKQDI